MNRFSYDLATRLYTRRYTHVDMENGKPVSYEPMSICTSVEMDSIFSTSDTWEQVLRAMHACIGTPGPKIAKGKKK